MKLQDLLFIFVFVIIGFLRKPIIYTFAGIFSLLMAIPLFHLRIFFTAERLTWYAAAFIAREAIGVLFSRNNVRQECV